MSNMTETTGRIRHALAEREASVDNRNPYNQGFTDALRWVLAEGDETYNGYANRETWAFNLHWQNDQGLYTETLEVARQNQNGTEDFLLGQAVVLFWQGYIADVEAEQTLMPRKLAMFRNEVGSWWRIDYAEVGAAVRESLDAEGMGEVDES